VLTAKLAQASLVGYMYVPDVRQQVIATLGRFDELQASGQLERLVRSGAREMLMERRHEVQRLLHYWEEPEPRAAALDVTSRLRQ
jgi:hypothetical protein